MDEIPTPKRPRLSHNTFTNMTSVTPGAGESHVTTNGSQSEESNVLTLPPSEQTPQMVQSPHSQSSSPPSGAQDGSHSNKEELNSSADSDKLLGPGPTICDSCTNEAPATNESRQVNLSVSDYDQLNGCADFIDRSLVAWRFFHDRDSIQLATAPPCFGKTTILSMLSKFFAIQINGSGNRFTNVKRQNGKFVEDLSSMSENFKTFKTKNIFTLCHCCSPPKKIACDHCKQWFYKHCGQHPVISINFGSVRWTSLEVVLESLNEVIRKAYKQHGYLVTNANGKTVWSSTDDEKMNLGNHVNMFLSYYDDFEHDKFWSNASPTDKEFYLLKGLPLLAEFLSLHFKTETTGKGVILLIDEMDRFVREMIFKSGNKEEIEKNVEDVASFFQDWSSSILKHCNFVERALLMACCTVGGMLSLGANNIEFRLFLDSQSPYSESFGFSKEEVESLVDVYLREDWIKKGLGKQELLKNINDWYNGYSVKGIPEKRIFSPFSVLKYLRSATLRSYWMDKVGTDCLDSLPVETPFQTKILSLLNSTESEVTIDSVPKMDPEYICKLNELIKNSLSIVTDADVDLYLQFLTNCGFFNVISRKFDRIKIKIPNLEIYYRLKQKVLSGLITKWSRKFNSSQVNNFIDSLKSLAKPSGASLTDTCLKIAKSIKDLYILIPKNHFELQADLYVLINQWKKCEAEKKIRSDNSPRIDLFFNIGDNTPVLIEVKHFNTATGVDEALKQILDKKYYECSECNSKTENIFLGVFLAEDGKVSVGCMMNVEEKNIGTAMDRRVCMNSEGIALFTPEAGMEEEMQAM